MNEIQVQKRWWYPVVKKSASYKTFAKLFSVIAHKADGLVYRLTDGDHTVVNMLTGLPIIQLETVGAKSGKQRIVPLIGILDGQKIVLIASNWGGSSHPAWYYNLRVNPNVKVTFDGNQQDYTAEIVEGVERQQYWELAVAFYGGYEAYQQGLPDRDIPVVLLSPSTANKLENDQAAVGGS